MRTETDVHPQEARAQTPNGSGAMFDGIAKRYDVLNAVLSFGQDRRWRRRLSRALAEPVDGQLGGEVLDVASGTGDVAVTIARRYPGVRVVGLDPSVEMLAVGREKVERLGLAERIALVEGDAMELPFDDDRFAATSIAFGIRNIPDRLLALREMARVTRPGGVVAVLELTQPRRGLMAPMARWHVEKVVPRLGAMLSGDAEYAYLQESIAAFPSPERFVETLQDAGLEQVVAERMSFGAVHLFLGTAPGR